MDRRERIDDTLTALKAALDQRQSVMWTALPGIVESVNLAEGTVSIQPALQEPKPLRDGTSEWVTIPILIHCPILFHHGGGFSLTLPIQAGDEGVILFSSRCIDAWWQQGGVQKQAELRMHDISDGMFIPGGWSKPNVPASISADAAQLRNADGTVLLEIGASGARVVGNLHVTGNITSDGDVTANADVPASKVTLLNHRHAANNVPPTPGF